MTLGSRPTTFAPPPAAAFLLVPFGVVAGGAWFWVAACLLAVLAARDDDYRAMLVWYGFALGFDPEAVVLAPFIVALAIRRNVSPTLLLLVLLSGAAMALTRALTGAAPTLPPFPLDLPLSRGAPNLWVLIEALPGIGELPLIGLAFCASVGAAAAYVAWFSARALSRHTLLDAVLLCTLVMAELLPGTHATVFALADITALTLALVTREPGRWRVAGLALAGTASAALAAPDYAPVAAAALLLATLLQARALLKPAANDNPLMPRTA